MIPYMKHGTKPEEAPIDLAMDDFWPVCDSDRPIAAMKATRSEDARSRTRSGIPYAGQHPESAGTVAVKTPDGTEYIANEIKIDYHVNIITARSGGVQILMTRNDVAVYLDQEHPNVYARAECSVTFR